MNYIKAVELFHSTFGHPINFFKNAIPLKLRQLRVKLLFEELQELSVASDVNKTLYDLCDSVVKSYKNVKDGDNVNKKEELDALCDIQYILSGTVLALGYQDIFDKGFEIVQNSNMSKGCPSLEEAEKSIAIYKEKGIDTFCIEKNGLYIILRTDDNKVLKYYKYIETDFSGLIF